MAKLTYLG